MNSRTLIETDSCPDELCRDDEEWYATDVQGHSGNRCMTGIGNAPLAGTCLQERAAAASGGAAGRGAVVQRHALYMPEDECQAGPQSLSQAGHDHPELQAGGSPRPSSPRSSMDDSLNC